MTLRNKTKAYFITALAVILPLAGAAWGETILADLDSYHEVPALSTSGSGKFTAKIVDNSKIEYELTYSGLEGVASQAHIHLGQPGVNGGISVFLCTNLGNGPKGTEPACPLSGTVKGTVDATDVIGPTGQGIASGEFDELIEAIRNGATYANVHTTLYPGGEIRGEIKGLAAGKPF